jgi:hypothetical protein
MLLKGAVKGDLKVSVLQIFFVKIVLCGKKNLLLAR